MNDVLERWNAQLQKLFIEFASDPNEGKDPSAKQRRNSSTKLSASERRAQKRLSQLLSLAEWTNFVAAAGMLLDGQGIQRANDATPMQVTRLMEIALDGVTRDHAAMIFSSSNGFVVDELAGRERLLHHTYADFLEALVRLCQAKVLPTASLLKQAHSRSVKHFFERVKGGILDPGSTRKDHYYIRRLSPDEPLADHLDVFISYIVDKRAHAPIEHAARPRRARMAMLGRSRILSSSRLTATLARSGRARGLNATRSGTL